jgi:hypothetical protein
LETQLGVSLPNFTNIAAVEWYDESQRELQTGDHLPACLFKDISEFFHPDVMSELQAILNKGGKLDYDTLKPVMRSSQAVVADAWCLNHCRRCVHPEADTHWAGTPCPDFSILGKGEGCDGPTMVYFTAWCCMRRRIQEAVVIQENVEGQPIDLLRYALGDLYNIQEVLLDPQFLGWPVRRRRMWRLLTHKSKVVAVEHNLDVLPKFFNRRCNISWKDFLVAPSGDVSKEVKWAASRKGSRAYHVPDEAKADLLPIQALSTAELAGARVYKRLAPGCVWNLGQNPLKIPIASETKLLNTVIKNFGIMYADLTPNSALDPDTDTGRWLTPYEILITQAVPCYDHVLEYMGVHRKLCSFNYKRADYGLPPRHS